MLTHRDSEGWRWVSPGESSDGACGRLAGVWRTGAWRGREEDTAHQLHGGEYSLRNVCWTPGAFIGQLLGPCSQLGLVIGTLFQGSEPQEKVLNRSLNVKIGGFMSLGQRAIHLQLQYAKLLERCNEVQYEICDASF